ncbi:hypothetical protein [Companilactobacillus metriopterae]|uniref:hypothetical protein n=1 Tax=Companilactobacillus metriopterae TaxID=1909267 RepID=UPI0019D6E398|nr:hypothetical protein [Companilactobacillus metriopterae]
MGGGMPGGGMPGSDSSDAATYKSASDYIKSLNENGTWVKYNKKTNKATITSVKAFVQNMKQPTKGVPAFDSLDLKDETEVFAYNNETPSHFDTVVANLLKKNEDKYSKLSDWNSDYVKSYGEINDNLDAVGSNVSHRMDMYNPMYYLNDYYDGYGTSKVAKYWRIRTGINQGDTALTVESNLSLALQANKNVKDVDFATVWGLKHTTAERTGSSENNLIKWVVKITK